MKFNNKTAKIIKKDFPIFKNNPGLIYLDNAATSQRPSQVIKVLTNFYEKENANPGRSIHTLAEKAMLDYTNARKTVANFINAKTNEIVFTRNATESLNLLSYTLPFIIKKGKNEILLTEMEHHSNLVPWQEMVKRNKLKLKFVRIKPDFTLDLKDLKKKLTKKTAILSFTYISNVLGTINPAKEIVDLAKQKGVFVIIDAAQAIQHLPIDVKKINCDFLVFSSHKMFGPMGLGVLYGKEKLLEKLPPFNFGGGMIKKVSLENSEFQNSPEKFEAGTQNVAEAIALAEAVRYIQNIGLQNIKKWENKLIKYTIKKLKEVPRIKLYNSKNSASIISFTLKGIHPHDVAELLNKEGIAIRAGHMCAMPLMEVLGLRGGLCRASFSFYNTFEDVDAFTEALKKIVGRFK
ncbi:MAG: SufS family cysteine desulfurase [Candidatus Pacearchaeota archaeon]